MRAPLLYLLFFLSGVSGLVYQVVWVRQFGNLFGNTVWSAAVVTAIFMCGLGVGGLLAGRLADRLHARDGAAPLRLYARVSYSKLWYDDALIVLGEVSSSPATRPAPDVEIMLTPFPKSSGFCFWPSRISWP